MTTTTTTMTVSPSYDRASEWSSTIGSEGYYNMAKFSLAFDTALLPFTSMAMKMKAMKAVVEEEVPKKAVRKMKAKKAAAKPKKTAARK